MRFGTAKDIITPVRPMKLACSGGDFEHNFYAIHDDVYGFWPGSVIVTYTHAHTAPAAKGYNPGAHDEAYEAFLLERSKACLDRAMCALAEETLECGTFDAGYNISRRGSHEAIDLGGGEGTGGGVCDLPVPLSGFCFH